MSVIKAIEFPNREFKSNKELHAELKKYKTTLISLKEKTPWKDNHLKSFHYPKSIDAVKNMGVEDGYIYAVINTTKVLDSHNDVHLDGIWNKSVLEQQGKIFYVADHDLSVKSVIAFPEDVEMMVKEVNFKDLGANYEGKTQALIFKILKENIKLDIAKTIIEEKRKIENSVRMRYVKIDLAINTNEKEFEQEKAVWDNVIGLIANKETAIERGYFWAVSEAAIEDEGSMVLRGSNNVTPLESSKEIEPQQTTPKVEPVSTQQEGENPSNDTQPKDGQGSFIYYNIV